MKRSQYTLIDTAATETALGTKGLGRRSADAHLTTSLDERSDCPLRLELPKVPKLGNLSSGQRAAQIRTAVSQAVDAMDGTAERRTSRRFKQVFRKASDRLAATLDVERSSVPPNLPARLRIVSIGNLLSRATDHAIGLNA